MKRAIRIEQNDNVAVVLEDVKVGEEVTVDGMDEVLCAVTDVPFPHKIALMDFSEKDTVIKYGHPIGWAKVPVKKGEHIHIHNIDFPDLQEK